MHAWKLSERESGGPVFGLMRLCKVRIENPKGVKQNNRGVRSSLLTTQ